LLAALAAHRHVLASIAVDSRAAGSQSQEYRVQVSVYR
jgi:hypothetical protein